MLRLRAVLLLLAACVSLAVLGAEVPLNEPLPGPAAGTQYGPLVASDGDGYFVVWSDARSGYAVRGTRVSREGQVLDGTGIPLFDNTYDGFPYVTWTGTSYLVLWGRYGGGEIVGLRIDRDGHIVDGPRVVAGGATLLGVASNATHVALLYWDREQNQTRARILTPDAAPVADFFVRAGIRGVVQVAAAGSQFAAIWGEGGGSNHEPATIRGIRFTAAGSLDAEPRLLVNDETHVMGGALASDGTSYLLLTSVAGTQATLARKISADLSSVGEAHLLPDAIRASSVAAPSLLWTGTSYTVFAGPNDQVVGTVLDRDGRPGETRTIESAILGGLAPNPVASTNGSELLIAWIGGSESGQSSIRDVYATIAEAPSLEPRTRALVSISAAPQFLPRVAASGTNLLAVWTERGSTYARRLHQDGSWLDAEPLRLGAAMPSHVVFNGAEYLVVSLDTYGHTISTLRIPKDGALRAEAGASLRVEYVSDIAVAVAGDVTLLAWIGQEGTRAVRLDRQATVLDPEPVVVTEEWVEHLAAASDGTGRFLLVWNTVEERVGSPSIFFPVAIRGTRFDTNLTRLDAGLLIADSPANEGEPAVTWNGSRWLVLWTHGRDEIRGRHVAADGTLADGVATEEGVLVAERAMTPEVTWDGSRYLAAWTTTDTPLGRLHAAWLPRLGGDTVLVHDLGERAWFPATDLGLAPLRPGAVAAVYARLAREPQYGSVSRAFASVLELPPGRRRAVR